MFANLLKRVGAVRCRVGKGPFLQPATRIGVALVHEHERMQPGAFATGGEEQREIEAGAEPLRDDLRREGHLLAGVFEAGGRIDVADAEFGDGLVDGGNLFPCAFAIFVLVTVERAASGGIAKQFRRTAKDRHERLIIRQDEGSENFRQRHETAPLVAREQRDRLGARAKHRVAGDDFNLEPAGDLLVEPREEIVTELQIELRNAKLAVGLDGLDANLRRSRECWLGGDANGEISAGNAVILKPQLFDDRNRILLEGVIYSRVVG